MSKVAFAAAMAVLVAAQAGAHVTLENRQASVSSYYKAVFAVPHGCAGSPTVKIRVQIPEGDWTTLGGFVFARLGRIPRIGDRVIFPGGDLEVIAMEGRRVAGVRINRGKTG